MLPEPVYQYWLLSGTGIECITYTDWIVNTDKENLSLFKRDIHD